MNIKEAEEYLIDRYGIKWKDYITSELDTVFLKMIAEDLEDIERLRSPARFLCPVH